MQCCLVSVTECNECGHQSHYRPPGNKCVSLDIYGTIIRLLQQKKEDLEREEDQMESNTNSNSNSNSNATTKKKGRHRRSRGGRTSLRYGNGSKLTTRHLSSKTGFNRALKSYGLCTLTDLLDSAMNTPVIFEGENQYFCGRCNAKVDAVKRDYYETVPDVLIFHLCRAYYNVDSGKQEKLQNKIQFPLTDLRMDSYIYGDNGDDAVYDLVAVLVHTGRSMNRGHYIAYCYHKETERWLKFDDVRVSVTTEKRVMESAAYLLFYEKQNVCSRLDAFLKDLQEQIAAME